MPAETGLATLTVALAPDAPLIRAGVAALLTASGDEVHVVDLPATGTLDLAGTAARAHDVVLYDPLAYDPRALAAATGRRRPPTLIAWSWSVRDDIATQARSQGAVALLSKSLGSSELVGSIRSLHAGRRTRFVVAPVVPATSRGRSTRVDGLTTRELEMLQMIAEGWTNDDIARQLFLSINSVKTYIRTAYRKIGVSRRSQAVLWGLHEGLTVRRDGQPGHPS